MLDDEKGMSPRVERGDLLHQGFRQHRVDAGGRLVQQDELRLRDQRTRKLQQLELPTRQRARQIAHHRLEAAEGDDLAGPFAVALLLPAHGSGRDPVAPEPLADLVSGHQHHVLEDGHLQERTRDLEGAREPRGEYPVRCQAVEPAAGEPDAAFVGRQLPRDGVEEGGLACTVRPDQPVKGAGLEVEGHSVDRPETAELLDKPLHHQQRIAHPEAPAMLVGAVPFVS